MDKEKLIKHIDYYLGGSQPSHYSDNGLYTKEGIIYAIRDFDDEAEVLSQEWIDDNKEMYLINDTSENAVPAYKLQNLLVPKQKEMKVSKTWHDVIAQNKEEGHSLRWTLNYIDNLNINDVDYFAKAWLAYPNIEAEEEQKYYVLGKHDTPILFKDYKNRTTESSNLRDIYPKANSEDFEFTEKEIKDYDPRYMTFAKPVEELDE